jgi:hypothetical protein
MKFKEIFDRSIVIEEHVRKGLKVYYEVDLELYKPTEEKVEQPQQPIQQNIQSQQPQDINNQSIQEPVQSSPDMNQQHQQDLNNQPVNQTQDTSGIDVDSFKLSSVTTEENEDDDDNKIIKKFEGEMSLNDSQKDNIQSFDDILEALSKLKSKGENMFDEFSLEIATLCANQNFDKLKSELDKKSKIFIEIYYGFKKDDSVGVRFSKRPNSDILTSTMLIDNEIVSSKFDINRINQQIVEYRNYEANK